MSQYFIYYASSNIVGVIIFGIMLAHDIFSIDRQEKQLRYDNALLAFMAYFISDAIWVAVDSGLLPVTRFTVVSTNLANFIIMTAITYTWFLYVLAVEKIPNRNEPLIRFLLILPFAMSTLVLIITYVLAPQILIGEDMKSTRVFDIFLVCIPYIYIIAVLIYAIRASVKEENKIEKKRHLYIGLFPIMVIAGGLAQMVLMPSLPIFCFSSTIFMIIFYIQSMEGQISTDPLTRLNNRAQLKRYVSQASNLHMEGKKDYVVMMDINDFKKINDRCGHAEGDRALVIIAGALTEVIRKHNYPVFLGRYGGDEFIMIVHVGEESELTEMLKEIRDTVKNKCECTRKPYLISMGIGYDLIEDRGDSFTDSMLKADEKMYGDKNDMKKRGKGTVFTE